MYPRINILWTSVILTDIIVISLFEWIWVRIRILCHKYSTDIHYVCILFGSQSTRHMINSSPGRLVTRSTRDPSTHHKEAVNSSQHAVNLSQAKASKHQSQTAVAIITLSLRLPPSLKNCPRKWADNKVNNKAHTVPCSEQNNMWSCESANAAQTNFSVVHGTNVAR